MTLLHLLQRPSTSIADIASHLDAASAGQRLAEAFALDRAGQRRLYQAAAAAPAIDLAHFVPPQVGEGVEVRHRGRNSLPLPAAHKLFEKRFCRPVAGADYLHGYNESPSGRWLGPGYFVAIPTAGNPDWTPRGAIVVDYFQVPPLDATVPAHWPRIRRNEEGIQCLVYAGTRDFMRRVSRHVSIGAAYKGEKALDHYFVLVRQDEGGHGAG